MSYFIVTFIAIFLALGAIWLSINPYDYRIPPYDAFLNKSIMELFEESERLRKNSRRYILVAVLLCIVLLWSVAMVAVANGQLVIPIG